jgi:hypothetical protein
MRLPGAMARLASALTPERRASLSIHATRPDRQSHLLPRGLAYFSIDDLLGRRRFFAATDGASGRALFWPAPLGHARATTARCARHLAPDEPAQLPQAFSDQLHVIALRGRLSYRAHPVWLADKIVPFLPQLMDPKNLRELGACSRAARIED